MSQQSSFSTRFGQEKKKKNNVSVVLVFDQWWTFMGKGGFSACAHFPCIHPEILLRQ